MALHKKEKLFGYLFDLLRRRGQTHIVFSLHFLMKNSISSSFQGVPHDWPNLRSRTPHPDSGGLVLMLAQGEGGGVLMSFGGGGFVTSTRGYTELVLKHN